MMGTSYSQKSETTYHDNLDYIHTGLYTSQVKGDQLFVEFRNTDKQKNFTFSSFISMDMVTVNEGNDIGNSYTIKGDAGTLELNPDGSYEFEESAQMKGLLKQHGLKKTPVGMYLIMTLGEMDTDCINLLVKENFDLNVNDLVAVASSKMNLAVLTSKIALLKTLKAKERNLKTLVEMQTMGVDEECIANMQKYTSEEDARDLSKITQWISMRIDAEFLDMLSKAGYTNPSFKDIISAKSHKIDADYLSEIKAQGYDDLTLKNMVTLRSMNITGPWIAKVNAKNGSRLPVSKLINLKTSSN